MRETDRREGRAQRPVRETDRRQGEAQRLARKARRREGRRDAILESAQRVLLRDGLDGLTTQAVAAEADVSKASLFYYFESKEEIVAALAEMLLAREAEVMLRAIEAAPGGIEALGALVRAVVDHHAADLDAFLALSTWVRQPGVGERLLRGSIFPMSFRVNDALEALLQQDRKAGRLHRDAHPRRLANLAYVGAHGLLSLLAQVRALGGDMRFSLAELRDELCVTLMRGATAAPSRARGRSARQA